MTTVFEALNLANPTEKQMEQFQEIGFKCATEQGYTRSDAVLDVMKVVGVEDTPENRTLTAHAMTFGEMIQAMQGRMKLFSELFGQKDDGDE